MPKPKPHRLIAVLIAALTLFAFTDAAVGASHSCVRRGMTIMFSSTEGTILSRKIGGYYEPGATRNYVCSKSYGRVIAVGDDGMTPDGPVWETPVAVNARYAAVVGGYGGNADGGTDTGLSVYDLRTGKRAGSASSSANNDAWEMSVSNVALSPRGELGWMTSYYDDAESRFVTELYKRTSGRKTKPKLLDRGPSADFSFLRWSDDGAQLIWADRTTKLAYSPRNGDDSDPLGGASCTRRGDRVLGRENGTIYVSKRFGAPGWSHGRVLLACSLKYRRRVAMAHSGEFRSPTDGVYTYSYQVPKVEEKYAGVATRRTAPDGTHRDTLFAYNLGDGDRICIADASPNLAGTTVTKTAISGANLAWLVTGMGTSDATGPQRLTELRVCDDKPVRTLATASQIDPGFLSFVSDDGPGIVISDHVKHSP